jgi:hydrogenase nickel incorporation protein HypA/HybF
MPLHELAVTESVLEIAQRHAREAGASRITDIYLVIGRLSSVVDESVQFYWDIISEGTPAQGARLHLRRVPVEMTCLDCELTYRPAEGELICPRCDGARVRVVTGDEFHLEAIDVDGVDPEHGAESRQEPNAAQHRPDAPEGEQR